MLRELIITPNPIDEAALVSTRKVAADMGAVVVFLGYVREFEDSRLLRGLEYEAFERMAVRQFDLLFDSVAERWPIHSIRLQHRTGFVPVNEASLWVEIISPHRAESLAACEWLINEMKRAVPIWKKAVFRE